jgi:hypothetical protein
VLTKTGRTIAARRSARIQWRCQTIPSGERFVADKKTELCDANGARLAHFAAVESQLSVPADRERSVVYVRAPAPRGQINCSLNLSSDQILRFDYVARVANICAVG